MYNKYSELRRRYLRTHKSGIYTGMLLTDKLDAHLKETGAAAEDISAGFPELYEHLT